MPPRQTRFTRHLRAKGRLAGVEDLDDFDPLGEVFNDELGDDDDELEALRQQSQNVDAEIEAQKRMLDDVPQEALEEKIENAKRESQPSSFWWVAGTLIGVLAIVDSVRSRQGKGPF